MAATPSGSQLSYPVLEHADSFRLLRLWQSDSGDPVVRCDLFTARQSERKGRYTALSYAWGPSEDCQAILVNQQVLEVRCNLFDFLLTWRGKECCTMLWVDAICIDQRDVEERNHQVQMMGDIYRNATQVCSWLGPADENSDLLFDRMANDPDCTSLGQEFDAVRSREQVSSNCASRPYNNLPESVQRSVQSLAGVARKTYFKRLWVVQEMLLAHEVYFLCGTKMISGSVFRSWFGSIREELIDRSCSDELCQPFEFADKEAGYWRTIEASDLYKSDEFVMEGCLKISGQMQCSKLHDKFFGILGLLPQEEQKAAAKVADYQSSIIQILANILEAFGLKCPIDFAALALHSFNLKASDLTSTLTNDHFMQLVLDGGKPSDGSYNITPGRGLGCLQPVEDTEMTKQCGSKWMMDFIPLGHRVGLTSTDQLFEDPVSGSSRTTMLAFEGDSDNDVSLVGFVTLVPPKYAQGSLPSPQSFYLHLLTTMFADPGCRPRRRNSSTGQQLVCNCRASLAILLAAAQGVYENVDMHQTPEDLDDTRREGTADKYWHDNAQDLRRLVQASCEETPSTGTFSPTNGTRIPPQYRSRL